MLCVRDIRTPFEILSLKERYALNTKWREHEQTHARTQAEINCLKGSEPWLSIVSSERTSQQGMWNIYLLLTLLKWFLLIKVKNSNNSYDFLLFWADTIQFSVSTNAKLLVAVAMATRRQVKRLAETWTLYCNSDLCDEISYYVKFEIINTILHGTESCLKMNSDLQNFIHCLRFLYKTQRFVNWIYIHRLAY